MDAYVNTFASSHNYRQKKTKTRPQKKYHPGQSENQPVSKFNNQGFKEAAFIQRGRRGGDVEKGGDMETWCGMERK